MIDARAVVRVSRVTADVLALNGENTTMPEHTEIVLCVGNALLSAHVSEPIDDVATVIRQSLA